MMKKIFIFLAFSTALLSCGKEKALPEKPAEDVRDLVLNITISSSGPDTRISYTETAEGGYKASLAEDDCIWAYFLKADNSVAGEPYKLTIDPATISEDGRSASFSMPQVNIPAGAVKIRAYLSNNASGITFKDKDLIMLDLSGQKDLNASLNSHVITGSANLLDLLLTDPDKIVGAISISYKTSMLRFIMNIPEGLDIETSDAIILSGAENSFHNKVHLFGGEPGAESTFGQITISPYKIEGGKAYAAVCFWAADNWSSSKLLISKGEENYGFDLELKKNVFEAGKVYDVPRDIKLLPKPASKWTNDEAGEADFQSGGSDNITNDWLSYAGGKVSWTANTTGAPRSAKLVFANGSIYEVTQMIPSDFKGNYELLSKRFAKPTAPYPAGTDVATPNIVFGEPLKGETLADVDGKSYTNHIGIKGLYHDGVMDACVDIDYKAKKVRVGMFLDARSTAGQAHNNSKLTTHPYVCFLPGMGTTKENSLWTSPWNFVQPDLSNTDEKDYTWLWFSVSEDFMTLNYDPNTAETIQYLNTDAATSANAICAITVAVSTSASIEPANVRQDWEMVYQGNPPGISFKKK